MLSAALLLAFAAVHAQKILRNPPLPASRVVEMPSGDTFIVKARDYARPMVFLCPTGSKCDILCTESPPPSLANYGGRPGVGVALLGSCENVTIIAGASAEVKVICLDWACNNADMQLSGELVTVECAGPNACSGAKIQCGAQAASPYLPLGVGAGAITHRCVLTCKNGGCAAESARFPGHAAKAGPNRPLRKGTSFRCTGAMSQCLVKANEQVQGFTYGANPAAHIGSYTGGEFICETTPGSPCMVECADTPGVHYCGGLKYMCRAHASQCRCRDYCQQNPGYCPPNRPELRDCATPQMPTNAPSPSPTAAPVTP